MTKKTKSQWSKYIRYLEAYRKEKNRGALAIMRRSLGILPELDVRTFPFVFPGIEIAELNKYQEQIAFMIAALYALYHSGSADISPSEEPFWNLGDSFRNLSENDEKGSKSIESRFIALLNAHKDDLIQHLKKSVSLLKSRKIPINWVVLAEDIQYWEYSERITQSRWAQSFYSPKI